MFLAQMSYLEPKALPAPPLKVPSILGPLMPHPCPECLLL